MNKKHKYRFSDDTLGYYDDVLDDKPITPEQREKTLKWYRGVDQALSGAESVTVCFAMKEQRWPLFKDHDERDKKLIEKGDS